MKYKAIIFDLDGTVSDTESIWTEATRKLITRRVALTSEQEKELAMRIHGLALGKVCEIIKDTCNLSDSVSELIHEQSELARSLYAQGVKFIQGFPEFHAQVVSHKFKVGMATNADDATLEITKKTLQLSRYFGEHIYNISCVNNVCKPDPAVYLYAAEQLRLDPRHCVAIEDSAHGIRAAKSAGMFCIGINTSQNHAQVKEADHIVDRYCDIDLKELLFLRK